MAVNQWPMLVMWISSRDWTASILSDVFLNKFGGELLIVELSGVQSHWRLEIRVRLGFATVIR